MKFDSALIFTWLILPLSIISQNRIPSPEQISHYSTIEKYILPPTNNTDLKLKELKQRKPGRPNHFAIARVCQIECHRQGDWEYLDDLRAIWRVFVKSPGAYSLNFGFSQYQLPESAVLFIYDPDQNQVLGPFTRQDNEDHLELWTPIIQSDEVIIELQVSLSQLKDVRLELAKVNHDFMDFGSSGISGSCNLDVACGEEDGFPLVDEYREVIPSVGGFTLNGIAQCTGVLINNTRNDCTPYFLTANHCEVNEFNAQTVVVYWNYQNSTCRQPGTNASGSAGDGKKNQFNSGAEMIAGYATSDFTLLLLDDPVNPEYQPYFAGWDIRSRLPGVGACIHHPGVEEKRISFDYDTLEYEIVNSFDTTFLRVVDWDMGTTEGGSSGAPLFNEEQLIVGQLTGGQASCSNDLWDSFGWIRRSWEGGGSPDTRLKDWLDPEQTGASWLKGKDCAFIVNVTQTRFDYCVDNSDSYQFGLVVSENFTDSVNLEFESIPDNLEAIFDKDRLQPGDTAVVLLNNLSALSAGTHVIEISADNSNGSGFTTFILSTTTMVPKAPVNLYPDDGSIQLSTDINFEWDGAAPEYELQIATDPDFKEVISMQDEIAGKRLSFTGLQSDQVYYWRVRGVNLCGIGPWSAAYSFEIGFIHCTSFVSRDLPKQITSVVDDTVISQIDFPFSGKLSDVKIKNIRGTHSWVSDLSFIIESPVGTRLKLLENACDNEDDFFISFDDITGLENVSCPLNDGKTYKSVDPLNLFTGEDPRGTWKFILIDGFSQDGGVFEQWELSLCVDLTQSVSLITSVSDLEVCESDEESISFFTGSGFGSPIEVSYQTDSEILNINIDDTRIQPGDTSYLTISNLRELSPGSHELWIYAETSENADSVKIDITRIPGPGPSILAQPESKSYDIDSVPPFEWSPDKDADLYELRIARDSLFQQIVYSEETELNSILVEGFEQGIKYFWRVFGKNACGSTSSEVKSFETKIRTDIYELPDIRFQIYPNPFDQFLQIRFLSPVKNDLYIALYDSSGKTIIDEQLTSYSLGTMMNTQNLKPGIFFLRIQSESGEYIVHKLVKI